MCFRVLLFTNPPPVALSVTTGVVGFWWTIVVREMCSADLHQQLTKDNPSYTSMALARIFFILVHSTCMGPLRGGCLFGGEFGSENGELS